MVIHGPGLPSQLRDAVLSTVSLSAFLGGYLTCTLVIHSTVTLSHCCSRHFHHPPLPSSVLFSSFLSSSSLQDDGTLAVPESEANQEYFASQHMALLADGNDPWQNGLTPNEKLLQIARNTVHDREQSKKKLAVIGRKRQAR